MPDPGRYPRPPFPATTQPFPGTSAAMEPAPDYGETTYVGSGRLRDRVAVVTGADSGIGRAIAVAYAREGADLVLSYLDETDDARETERLVAAAGRRAELVPGDLTDPAHAAAVVRRAVDAFGRLDVLVSNAAFQKVADAIEDVEVADWTRHFDVNVHALFYLVKAAVPHLRPGGSIIATASINAKTPPPQMVAYSATKAAITNITANLAQSLGKRGIRVNAVLPGPIWTPLIPATMKPDDVESFGSQTPLGRPGQPAELAGAYVLLASEDGSYMNGAMLAVTGGMPAI